jgi:hypothetical protein
MVISQGQVIKPRKDEPEAASDVDFAERGRGQREGDCGRAEADHDHASCGLTDSE